MDFDDDDDLFKLPRPTAVKEKKHKTKSTQRKNMLQILADDDEKTDMFGDDSTDIFGGSALLASGATTKQKTKHKTTTGFDFGSDEEDIFGIDSSQKKSRPSDDEIASSDMFSSEPLGFDLSMVQKEEERFEEFDFRIGETQEDIDDEDHSEEEEDKINETEETEERDLKDCLSSSLSSAGEEEEDSLQRNPRANDEDEMKPSRTESPTIPSGSDINADGGDKEIDIMKTGLMRDSDEEKEVETEELHGESADKKGKHAVEDDDEEINVVKTSLMRDSIEETGEKTNGEMLVKTEEIHGESTEEQGKQEVEDDDKEINVKTGLMGDSDDENEENTIEEVLVETEELNKVSAQEQGRHEALEDDFTETKDKKGYEADNDKVEDGQGESTETITLTKEDSKESKQREAAEEHPEDKTEENVLDEETEDVLGKETEEVLGKEIDDLDKDTNVTSEEEKEDSSYTDNKAKDALNKNTEEAIQESGQGSRPTVVVENIDVKSKSESLPPHEEKDGVQTSAVNTRTVEDSQGQIKDTEMVKCCNCNLLSLPVDEKARRKILELKGESLAMGELVSIMEKENQRQREQYTAERKKVQTLEMSVFNLKLSLSEEQGTCEQYRSKCEELEESLNGKKTMVTMLEEQLNTANSYNTSGVDYMLESQLAQGRMAAAEARAKGAQTELLQLHDEIKRLLDQLNRVNQEKREMVSWEVHQELLKISDETAREAKLQALTLKSENALLKRNVEELREQLKYKSESTTAMPANYNLGDWYSNQVQQKARENLQIEEHSTKGSLYNTQQILTHAEKPHTNAPLAASTKQASHDKDDDSSSCSDWGSDREADKENMKSPVGSTKTSLVSPTSEKKWSRPSSPEKTGTSAIQAAKAALHPTHVIKPPVSKKPTVAPKPAVPPKPGKKPAMPTKPKESNIVAQEKAVSFEESVSTPALNVLRKPAGPKGRRLPSQAIPPKPTNPTENA